MRKTSTVSSSYGSPDEETSRLYRATRRKKKRGSHRMTKFNQFRSPNLRKERRR